MIPSKRIFEMNDTPPSEDNEAPSSEPGIRWGSAAKKGLFALFLLMVGYGLWVGDVFETYENGSNL
jgi:hypothetical protein